MCESLSMPPLVNAYFWIGWRVKVWPLTEKSCAPIEKKGGGWGGRKKLLLPFQNKKNNEQTSSS